MFSGYQFKIYAMLDTEYLNIILILCDIEFFYDVIEIIRAIEWLLQQLPALVHWNVQTPESRLPRVPSMP
jgi:hypothetical protein